MGQEIDKVPEVSLLKSELEAAAARVAERAMNTTLDGVTGVIGDAFGGLVGDGIKQWRVRRLVDQLIKTKLHLEKQGIPIEKAKALPMAQALEIFEGTSKQEDTDLSAMWAALLSNSMNPNSTTFIDPSFPKILSSLSGLDAQILNYISEYSRRIAIYEKEVGPFVAKIGNPKTYNTPEYHAAMGAIEGHKKRFLEEAAAMKDAITSAFAAENIAYSTSHLHRLDLIYWPTERAPDLVLAHETRRGQIQIIDQNLQSELETIKAMITMGSEAKSRQIPLFNGAFDRHTSTPLYALTGLGKRFLAACT